MLQCAAAGRSKIEMWWPLLVVSMALGAPELDPDAPREIAIPNAPPWLEAGHHVAVLLIVAGKARIVGDWIPVLRIDDGAAHLLVDAQTADDVEVYAQELIIGLRNPSDIPEVR